MSDAYHALHAYLRAQAQEAQRLVRTYEHYSMLLEVELSNVTGVSIENIRESYAVGQPLTQQRQNNLMPPIKEEDNG
jgi:hypothetical protein